MIKKTLLPGTILAAMATLGACGGGSSGGSSAASPSTPAVPVNAPAVIADYPAGSSSVDGVYTYHNDLNRSGQNIKETILTKESMVARTFGNLYSYKVKGQVYAQPLYVAKGTSVLTGNTDLNMVFVATEHDIVYGFDADSTNIVWTHNFLTDVQGATTVSTAEAYPPGSVPDIRPEIGITATPVIDPTTGSLYVVSKTKENGQFIQRLHQLDIKTGLDTPNSPVVIQASLPGNGGGSSGGVVAFDPLKENARAGLALAGGRVYITYASHGDVDPYHGWIISYDSTTLKRVGVYCSTPNGQRGGIWQGGGAPAIDTANNLYFLVGNGTFNGAPSGSTIPDEVSDSAVKVSTLNDNLQTASFFTPSNQQTLTDNDTDVGSGGVLLLPDQTGGSTPHLMVGGGKEGKLYVLNRDNLGGYNPNDQIIPPIALGTEIFSTPAFWNGMIYIAAHNDVLRSFELQDGGGLLPLTHTNHGFSGGIGQTVSISANGDQSGIAWVAEVTDSGVSTPAVLRAFDASDLTNEIYNSSTNPLDAAGPDIKFAVPTVFNGHVYVGGHDQVTVYGLKN